MKSIHFVTGATGFVGAALVVELLQRTSDDVVCLVRSNANEDATTRLHRLILHAAECYDAPEGVKRAVRDRCRAVAGDVELPYCGVSATDDLACTQFWHSAASLRFEERFAEEILRTNVQGTANALDLATRLGVSHFNYMSTAYVCGSRSGRILEAEAPDGVALNNQYEKSKVAAERLVSKDQSFGRRIFRPSIVIGHSRTRAATNFTGMYGFLRKLLAFKGMMERTQAGLLNRKSVRLRLDSFASLDLVPIDCVVSHAVTIMQATNPAKHEVQYYHLTNPTAPTMGESVATVVEAAGLSPLTFVPGNTEFDWLDEQFNSRIDFYSSYFIGAKTFDRSETERIVGPESAERYALPPATLAKHCLWYVDQLKAERANLPKTR